MAVKKDEDLNLAQEIRSFRDLWEGGYCEGDPLSPMSPSGYGEIGYMSILHVIYLLCIKPYINENTVVCEIGPGRGAWTRCLLKAKEVWCLDALSAEHNGFWENVGKRDHVKYFQVSDFKCEMLPENTFDYLFSFGCLCHVSFDGITAYMKNLYPKLKKGAHCFIMVADYDKYNKALSHLDEISVFHSFTKKISPLVKIYRALKPNKALQKIDKNEGDQPVPGRWYHAGVERTCKMLESFSYRIIESDVGANHRDPIIHFTKD